MLCFFQWFVCRVSRKVGLLKRRVRSHVVRGEIKNCTPLWREAHFEWTCTKHLMVGALFEGPMRKNCTRLWREARSEVKMLKNWGSRSTFWRSNVAKLHAAVARSTFRSQNVKKLRFSEHFFEVLMSQNCTPLWREAHSEVKMLKNWGSRSTFWSSDVAKLHAAVARSTFRSQNVKKLRFSEHFLKFWCRKIARRCGEKHIQKWKSEKPEVLGPLFEVRMSQNCTPLWREAHSEVKMYKTRQQHSFPEVLMSKN